ncbi:uncharacterized protein LOC136075918 [Hydra vulgaris]|uniref:Uncharacterized protein LOC136075918 n=1 Tax=Hydra vulgaris TaxID=6087 RepID=A0ABM4B962_HYDVU
MTPTKYEHLLSLIAPAITKSSLRRETIGASERLMVTLRYVFGGTSQIDLAAIQKSEDEWKAIANEFEKKWNFSNCIGAIDGKHIVMQAPSRLGSFYFNYKKSHSIVLMAICNANYEFTLIDIGDTGRNSDGGVFQNSKIGIAFESNLLHIPEPKMPNGSNVKLPYVLIGDEAFPLKNYLMKPYPKEIVSLKERIYNYRLSRAHRIEKKILSGFWQQDAEFFANQLLQTKKL